MIDTKDIRLGNLVLDKHGKPSKVSEIGKTGIKVEGISGTYRQYAGEFSPIPISEDWLISMGFHPEGFSMSRNDYIREDGWVYISEYIDGHFSWTCSEQNIDLNYVHQLQNLYYALTGKELKINMELL